VSVYIDEFHNLCILPSIIKSHLLGILGYTERVAQTKF